MLIIALGRIKELKKGLFRVLLLVLVFGLVPTVNVSANIWQMKYVHWYKVRVLKSTKADQETGNVDSWKSHITYKRFRLHKGQVVYTSYMAINGIDWALTVGKKYTPTKKHQYEAHFSRHSFKVIKEVPSGRIKW